MFQHYFGWMLAWCLLSSAALHRPGAVAAMFLFLLGTMGIVACTCSADDLVGFRNGSDAKNYEMSGHGRDIRAKPLLSGAVTEREALVFVTIAGTIGLGAGIAAFWALGWQAPVAAYVLYLAGGFLSVQYSAGLRLSYHRGGSETLLCGATACGLLAPYLAVARHWSLSAVLVALLLGLWLVMVSSYSNVNDAEGDRQVGRRTLAVTTGPQAFKAAMVAFFVLSVTLTCTLAFGTNWPWWTLLTMLPAIFVHLAQLYVGPISEQWLSARRLGLIAYNLGFLGLGIPASFVFFT